MNTLLTIHWHVNPVLLHIFNLEIRWYSLLFVSGFILGWYLFLWFVHREKVSETMLDPLLYTMLAATIVGARLGHCLFYQPDYYLGSWQGFIEIFQPWKGGLASHGAAIGIILALIWFGSKYGPRYKVDFWWVVDRICITIAFAGCMIRLGNLFNSEIYGDVTNLPWGFIFELRGETLPKHPTQLYEAFGYMLLGFAMVWIYKYRLDKVYRGFFFGMFLTGCFTLRFFIEFIKEPQVEFEQGMLLNMGQLLSIPFIIGGIALLIFSYRKRTPSMAG